MGPTAHEPRKRSLESVTKFRLNGVEPFSVGVLKGDASDGRVPCFRVYDEIERFNKERGTSVRLLRPHMSQSVMGDAIFERKFRSMPFFPLDVFIACERPYTPLGDKIVHEFPVLPAYHMEGGVQVSDG